MEIETAYFNQGLYDALRKEIGDRYDSEAGRRVVDAVHSTLVDALGAERDEISAGAFLVSDLLAESIDGWDIAFRIERRAGIIFSRDNGPLALAMLYKNPGDAEPKEKTALDLAKETYLMIVKKKS